MVLSALVAIGLALPAAAAFAGSVDAGSLRYARCAQMREDFPNGVARSSAAAAAVVADGGRRARVSAATYAANRHLDKDHDGVACESRGATVTAPPQAGTIEEPEGTMTGEEAFVYDLVNAFLETWPARVDRQAFCRDLASQEFADESDAFYADLADEAVTFYDVDPDDARQLVESTLRWTCQEFAGIALTGA